MMTSAEALDELNRRRNVPLGKNQLSRCTQALFPIGEVRRGPRRGRRYRPEHLELVDAGIDLVDATGITYGVLQMLYRFALERGEDPATTFRALVRIADTHGLSYTGPHAFGFVAHTLEGRTA